MERLLIVAVILLSLTSCASEEDRRRARVGSYSNPVQATEENCVATAGYGVICEIQTSNQNVKCFMNARQGTMSCVYIPEN